MTLLIDRDRYNLYKQYTSEWISSIHFNTSIPTPQTASPTESFAIEIHSTCLPATLRRWSPITYSDRDPVARKNLDKDSFKEAMSTLVRDFGESMPNSTAVHPDDWNKKDGAKRKLPLIFLHSGLFSTKAAVFRDMIDLALVSSHLTESTLHKWWSKYFWNVKIKHWQPFAKCEPCILFKARLLSCITEPAREICRLQQGAHRDQVCLDYDRLTWTFVFIPPFFLC